MLKRLLVAMVGLVGVVVVALGVASATLWRADDVLVAELRADEPLVVTDPGVLELADARVTVRAEADGPVVLAVGRDTDVVGWVGTDAHERVTGLAGWHELAADVVATPTPSAAATDAPEAEAAPEEEAAPEAAPEAEAAPEVAPEAEAAPEGDTVAPDDGTAEDAAPVDAAATVPDPTGSDLWIVETRGDGEAELTWSAQPGRWSLLAASVDGSPLRVSLAWPQVVTTPWLWPCVVAGSLLVLLAAGLLLRDVQRSRRRQDEAWTPVATGPLPVVGPDGQPTTLTRRQLRELAARGATPALVGTAPRQADTRPGAEQDARTSAGPEALETERADRADRSDAPPAAATAGSDAAAAARTPGAPRWSVGGPGPSPWSAGRHDRPAADARPSVPGPGEVQTPAPGASPSPEQVHPAGRPAWLSRGGSAPGSQQLPAPGAPGSPDDTRSPGPRLGAVSRTEAPARRSQRAVPSSAPPPRADPPERPGWAPVPPVPSATTGRPSSPDALRTGPADSSASRGPRPDEPQGGTPRPAWLRDAPVPSGPRSAAAGDASGGSRADAWRRAWGLPATDDDSTTQEENR